MNIITPEELFSLKGEAGFTQAALEIFRYQASACPVYASFINNLGIDPGSVKQLAHIPFIPVEFFKSHPVICSGMEPEIIFSSSATTGMIQSRHLVARASLYRESFRKAFFDFYGEISKYTLLALLPSYQERAGSSLIYMVDDLIRQSRHDKSGYFLYNIDELHELLTQLQQNNSPVILMGVTYALLDFVEKYQLDFPELVVMETGGMKGRRREMIRPELHELLCKGFGVPAIHSEYGMTELLSQAYSKGNGIFSCPAWMRVLIRDINDPFSLLPPGQTGGINVIDLANMYSCSFIATQDLGKLYPDESFEVLGRFDNSDIRGCNLLVQ